MVRVGKGKGKGKVPDIIPSDFFTDLGNEVDSILDQRLAKSKSVPVLRTPAVAFQDDVSESFRSKGFRDTPRASATSLAFSYQASVGATPREAPREPLVGATPREAATEQDESDEASQWNATLLLQGADGESMEAGSLIASNAPTLTKPKPKRPPPHKYHFRSGERFASVRAVSYQEAKGRLRQYLLMKYGSYRRAFEKLEESVEMTGLAGCREEHEGPHVSGMLHHREFTNAVSHLIPHWAEITGIGNLGHLFKSIDDNDSGYISFEELMGCKLEDPMANHVSDFDVRRPLKHCPFRKAKKQNPVWNLKQIKTNVNDETFQAAMKETNMDEVMKSLAPSFTPIFNMPLHHHDEEDGGSSMCSEAHSSEQVLNIEHIRLRLRAAGFTKKMKWRKAFQHYDQKSLGEIDWFRFRSIVRKDAQITPDLLTEEDLKELFYSLEQVQEAPVDCIFYEPLLEWLEAKPTKEEAVELTQVQQDAVRYAQMRHFHKTPKIRKLEVERRRVAEDHRNHMSCNPCTKQCDICGHVILVCSWAAHRHGCGKKEEDIEKKEKDEIAYAAQWNFQPKISAYAKTAKGLTRHGQAEKRKDCMNQWNSAHRFPIREKIEQRKMEEIHENTYSDLTFAPHLNNRSRQIHKFSAKSKPPANALANASAMTDDIASRLAMPIERTQSAPSVGMKDYTPQITAKGMQKGFERGGESVFHRLLHGPKDDAVLVDPGTEKDELSIVQNTTDRLMKSRTPIDMTEAEWDKMKQSQKATYDDLMARARAEGKLKGASSSREGEFRSPLSPSSFGRSPGEEGSMDLESAEVGGRSHVVTGTHKVMALLERWDQVAKMKNG